MEFRNSLLKHQISAQSKRLLRAFLPLNGPVHGDVCDNEGGSNVKNLVAETTEDVQRLLDWARTVVCG